MVGGLLNALEKRNDYCMGIDRVGSAQHQDEKLAYARVMQIIILADKSIMNSCN